MRLGTNSFLIKTCLAGVLLLYREPWAQSLWAAIRLQCAAGGDKHVGCPLE